MKQVHITVDNASAEIQNDLGWSDDDSEDEAVDNTSAPTEEEIDNKLKAFLVK